MAAPFNPFDTGSAPVGTPAQGSSSSGFPPPAPSPEQPLTALGPPMVYLMVAAALGVVGSVVAALSIFRVIPPGSAAIGWSLAGPLAIGVIGSFLAQDTKRRAAPLYVAPASINVAMWITGAAAMIGTIVGSLGMAMWVGHLW